MFRRTVCGYTLRERWSSSISTADLGDGVATVAVAGEVDLYTAPALKQALSARDRQGARSVLVDLSRATFIDSTTLGVLMGAVKRLRPAGGELAIACSDPNIRKIFEITLLDRIFDDLRSPGPGHRASAEARGRSSGLELAASLGQAGAGYEPLVAVPNRFDERDPAAGLVALDRDLVGERPDDHQAHSLPAAVSLVLGDGVARVEAGAVVLDLDLDAVASRRGSGRRAAAPAPPEYAWWIEFVQASVTASFRSATTLSPAPATAATPASASRASARFSGRGADRAARRCRGSPRLDAAFDLSWRLDLLAELLERPPDQTRDVHLRDTDLASRSATASGRRRSAAGRSAARARRAP